MYFLPPPKVVSGRMFPRKCPSFLPSFNSLHSLFSFPFSDASSKEESGSEGQSLCFRFFLQRVIPSCRPYLSFFDLRYLSLRVLPFFIRLKSASRPTVLFPLVICFTHDPPGLILLFPCEVFLSHPYSPRYLTSVAPVPSLLEGGYIFCR